MQSTDGAVRASVADTRDREPGDHCGRVDEEQSALKFLASDSEGVAVETEEVEDKSSLNSERDVLPLGVGRSAEDILDRLYDSKGGDFVVGGIEPVAHFLEQRECVEF